MALRLMPPERSAEALKAIAASGASGLSKKAQRELQARMRAQLEREREAGR